MPGTRIPPLPPLTDWNRGDKFTARHLQEPVAALKTIMRSMAQGGDDYAAVGREMWPGIIVAKGPNGEAAPAGAQYWAQKQTTKGDKPTAKLAFTPDQSDQLIDPNYPNIFSVTNLPEWISGGNGSHTLAVGAAVLVFAWWDAGSPNGQGMSGSSSSDDPIVSNKRYMCVSMQTGGIPVQVKVDGGVAGSMATSTTCSWTYSLFDQSGTALKDSGGTAITGKTPDVTRYTHCAYDRPADNSPGMAYYDASGAVHLYSVAQEKPTGATINVYEDSLDGSGNLIKTPTPILVLDKGVAGSPTTIVPGCS